MPSLDQLPLECLVDIILDLELVDKHTLLYVDRYFHAIVAPIFYRDAIYFRAQPDGEELIGGLSKFLNYLNENKKKNKLHNEIFYPEANVALWPSWALRATLAYKQNFASQINALTWKKLLPTIHKYNRCIVATKSIDPDNFLAELDAYTNLKEIEISLSTQEQINKFAQYEGTVFERVKSVKLYNDTKPDFEFNLLTEICVKEGLNWETIDRYIYPVNIDWLFNFKCNNLSCLGINVYTLNFDFFFHVNTNFPNLHNLFIKAKRFELPETTLELPIFPKVVELSVSLLENPQFDFNGYFSNDLYWPRVKRLSLEIHLGQQFQLEGKWSLLQSLNVDEHNLPDPYKFSQMMHIKSLTLKSYSQRIFTPITELLESLVHLEKLEITGFIRTQLFQFEPKFQLKKLKLSSFFDFTKNLVDFIQSQVSCRSLSLEFVQKDFEKIFNDSNLNALLLENSILTNLISLSLFNASDQLEKWFVDGSPNLKEIVRVNNGETQVTFL